MRTTLFTFIIIINWSCANDDMANVIPTELSGCIDKMALNYSTAQYPDNSCIYEIRGCSECDLIVDADIYRYDNKDIKLPAGSTICIPGGERNRALFFENFKGNPGKPFIFSNCDGMALINTSSTAGIRFYESNHIRFTGTGSSDTYGIQIKAKDFGFVAENRSSDIEVDHIKILSSGNSGISIRTNPTCDGRSNRGSFIQYNTSIHHNHITNTNNEGLYIGGSHWHTGLNYNCDEIQFEAELKGVNIYNNLLENIGRDGIQLGSAVEDSKIFNNVINGFGINKEEAHQAGIQINPGTTGEVFNNLVANGSGRGIFLQGFDLLVYNNVIVNIERDGIITTDRDPKPGKGFYIINNTFYNINGDMLEMISNQTANNVMYNNVGLFVEGEIMKNGTSNVTITVKNNALSNDNNDIQFTDPENCDFSLKATSPLIDYGFNVDMYNIKIDYSFKKRIEGSKVDLGAIEFKK